MSMAFDWREISDDRLRNLAKDYSATEIGKQLGCSRNAVIGRCMRRKIPLAKNAGALTGQGIIIRIREHEKAKKPVIAPVIVKIEAAAAPEAEAVENETDHDLTGVTVMDLRDGICRWPLWKGDVPFARKRYCGAETAEGSVYCAHCSALSYQPRRTDSLDKKLGIFKFRRAA